MLCARPCNTACARGLHTYCRHRLWNVDAVFCGAGYAVRKKKHEAVEAYAYGLSRLLVCVIALVADQYAG